MEIWIAIVAIVGPLVSAALAAWIVRAGKKQDWKRQDELALKAERAIAVAEAAAAKAAEDAKSILAANQLALEKTMANGVKLDVIHALSNSAYTAALQAELNGAERELVLMNEVIELKKGNNGGPSEASLKAVGVTTGRIAELRAALDERLRQAREMEQAKEAQMLADLKGPAAPVPANLKAENVTVEADTATVHAGARPATA